MPANSTITVTGWTFGIGSRRTRPETANAPKRMSMIRSLPEDTFCSVLHSAHPIRESIAMLIASMP